MGGNSLDTNIMPNIWPMNLDPAMVSQLPVESSSSIPPSPSEKIHYGVSHVSALYYVHPFYNSILMYCRIRQQVVQEPIQLLSKQHRELQIRLDLVMCLWDHRQHE
jgi:hypothetical protein